MEVKIIGEVESCTVSLSRLIAVALDLSDIVNAKTAYGDVKLVKIEERPAEKMHRDLTVYKVAAGLVPCGERMVLSVECRHCAYLDLDVVFKFMEREVLVSIDVPRAVSRKLPRTKYGVVLAQMHDGIYAVPIVALHSRTKTVFAVRGQPYFEYFSNIMKPREVFKTKGKLIRISSELKREEGPPL